MKEWIKCLILSIVIGVYALGSMFLSCWYFNMDKAPGAVLLGLCALWGIYLLIRMVPTTIGNYKDGW